MKRLHQLTIREFRNVQRSNLRFRAGLNVVLGKNAAGKTSLLKLLTKLLSLQLHQSQDETFKAELRLGNGDARLKRDVEVIRDGSELLCLEHLEFEQGDSRLGATVADGAVRLGGQNTFVVGPDIHKALERQLGTTYGAFQSFFDTDVFRLDESLQYFSELSSLGIVQAGQHVGSSFKIPKIPTELIPANLQHDSGGPWFAPNFLKRVAIEMGYERGFVRFDPESNGALKTYTNFRYFFERGTSLISHKNLSYGEQRMLAFFAASAACPDIVVADELVNGLHHAWIKTCIDEIGSRQAFLTSQNPLLLDYLEFDSADDVATGLVLCLREETANGAQLIWRNPTADEAAEFFKAYKTGIQSVSDILIWKGMW